MKNVMNCDANSSFEEVSSDHKIVSAKIRLSSYKKKQKIKALGYNWCSLANRDISHY